MLKKLLGRHRFVRIGATIVGASALAIGFASPAFAAQNVNNGNADNATSLNYLIVQGGSNTAYPVMQAEADIFNSAPGCDLVGVTSTSAPTGDQPLDYGCPGFNDSEGTAQPVSSSETLANVTLTLDSHKLIIPTTDTITTPLEPGMEVYDSQGLIPVGSPITTMVKGPNKPKIAGLPSQASTTDSVTFVTTPQVGENGYSNWGQENPYNDVLVEEPSYGSSGGILELEGTGNATTVGNSNGTLDPATSASTTGTGPVNVAPIDSARSSRAPSLSSHGDDVGLNFVAYAEDAVSDLYWTELNGAQTDASKCLNAIGGNPTTAELKLIWNSTWSGTPPVPTDANSQETTWANVFGTPCSAETSPIYPYWAQNGSGTESTWASATGAGFPGTSSNWPSDQIIFENETTSILRNAATTPIGDVLFFFSYGKFNKVCTSTISTATPSTDKSTNPLCAGTSTSTVTGAKPNQVELGTEANGIVLNQGSINAQLPGQEAASYFADRLLYNVYSNGSNPNIPATNAATLNAISEDGFMCKPSTANDVDPGTGDTYLSEIDNVITSQGFFPLPGLQVEDGQGDATTPIVYPNPGYSTTSSGITDNAWTLGATLGTKGLSASQYNATNETFNQVNRDTDNSAIQGTYSDVETTNGATPPVEGLQTVTATPTNPVGYCITLSTNSSSAGNGPG